MFKINKTFFQVLQVCLITGYNETRSGFDNQYVFYTDQKPDCRNSETCSRAGVSRFQKGGEQFNAFAPHEVFERICIELHKTFIEAYNL